jgi:hypothetical protein
MAMDTYNSPGTRPIPTEPRGMGSVVRIKAFDPLGRNYFTVWESPNGEGDPTIQLRSEQLERTSNEYRVY